MQKHELNWYLDQLKDNLIIANRAYKLLTDKFLDRYKEDFRAVLKELFMVEYGNEEAWKIMLVMVEQEIWFEDSREENLRVLEMFEYIREEKE